MSNNSLKTVLVYRPDLPGGKLLIDKSDFDSSNMTLFEEHLKQSHKEESIKVIKQPRKMVKQ
jgi:hypothetical protein